MRPLTSLTNLTPNQVISNASQAGCIPVGNYKGSPAFWDLDKAVNQPLVLVEEKYILGILDGRTEDTDLQTQAVTLAEAIGTIHSATLTVPAGEVWFVNAIETVVPASGGANLITANWRCNLWTDLIGALAAGQNFHGADYSPGAGGGTDWAEFNPVTVILAVTNKPVALRLAAGTILTFTFINTVAVSAGTVNCISRVYGYKGKVLVA